MRKLVPLLLVLAIALTMAPAAMAEPCLRCKPDGCGGPHPNGFEICEYDWMTGCFVSIPCSAGSAPEPLAAEFAVASVERLDEPDAKASETLVASLETPEPTNR